MGVVKYTGPVASFHCPTNAEIRSLKVHFSPKQEGSGDPSPENVREISGTNGITCYYGKEVLTIGNFDSIGRLQYLGSNTFFVEGETSNGVTIKNIPIEKFILKPNKEYSIICEYISGQFGDVFAYRFQDANNFRLSKTYNNLDTNTKLYIASPTPVETQYNFIKMTLSVGPGTSNLVFKMHIIETPGTLSSNWSSTIGTLYGGWVDLISGEVCDNWWKDSWNIGADEGTIKSDGTRWIAKNIPSAHNCNTDLREKSVCDELLCAQIGSDPRPRFYMSKVTAYMNLSNDNLPHTITIWYPSVSVTATYHLAPTELQTFLGQNNVWSNADYVEVEYDLHETQDILARKNFIMANQPHVVTPAAAPLQNFVTDMVAPLKECKVHFSPIQDLHGYDNPWPAGGEKNVFSYPYVDTTKTDNGITFTDLGDGQIKITGTNNSSSYVYFILKNDLDFGNAYNSFSYVAPSFVNGDYTLKFFGMVAGVGAEYFKDGLVRFRITSGATVNTTVGPAIYKTSDNLSAFIPYENICPISGTNYLTVYSKGQSLIDFTGTVIRWYVPQEFLEKSVMYCGYIDNTLGTNTVKLSLRLRDDNNKSLGTYYSAQSVAPGECKIICAIFTIDTNVNNIQFSVSNTSADTIINGRWLWPYESEDLTIDFDSSLYGGYVDLVTREVVQEWDIIELNNSSQFNKWNRDYNELSYLDFYIYLPNVTECISNITKACSTRSVALSSGVPSHWVQTGSNSYVGFMFPASFFSTHPTMENRNDLIQEILNHSSITLAYKTNQTAYSITPQTLKTLRGTNNIWSSANGNIEIKYWKH